MATQIASDTAGTIRFFANERCCACVGSYCTTADCMVRIQVVQYRTGNS